MVSKATSLCRQFLHISRRFHIQCERIEGHVWLTYIHFVKVWEDFLRVVNSKKANEFNPRQE